MSCNSGGRKPSKMAFTGGVYPRSFSRLRVQWGLLAAFAGGSPA